MFEAVRGDFVAVFGNRRNNLRQRFGQLSQHEEGSLDAVRVEECEGFVHIALDFGQFAAAGDHSLWDGKQLRHALAKPLDVHGKAVRNHGVRCEVGCASCCLPGKFIVQGRKATWKSMPAPGIL